MLMIVRERGYRKLATIGRVEPSRPAHEDVSATFLVHANLWATPTSP